MTGDQLIAKITELDASEPVVITIGDREYPIKTVKASIFGGIEIIAKEAE